MSDQPEQSDPQPQPLGDQPPQPEPGHLAYPPAPAPAWAASVRRPDPMPAGPREYHQLNRGGRYAWWRPLLTLLLTFGFYLVANIVVSIAWVMVVYLLGKNPLRVLNNFTQGHSMGVLMFAYVEATLVILVPVGMLSSWLVNRIRPRYLTSVAGGFRWSWFRRCLMITVPVWVVYLGLQLWLDWDYGAKPAHWGVLLILVVVGIPFQSAGEEFAFRGLILQNVGAWIPNRKVALAVAAVPSMGLFALAHGSLHGWILIDLALFALSSIILVWRTGGLEASIALHATNNVILMICTILFGGWSGAFVGSQTTGSAAMILFDLVVYGIPVALILWQAKKTKIQRVYRPIGPAQVAGAPAADGSGPS